MLFNPQAVLLYSPPAYEAQFEFDNKLQHLSACLQANGNYSVHAAVAYNLRHQLDPMFAAHGLPSLAYSRQVSMLDACKMMKVLGARIDPAQVQQGAAYAAFLQAQLDAFGAATPPPEFVQARTEFVRMATVLLQEIQKSHFQTFAIRELVNPVQSLALSKQRKGIFIWPDWQDPRYVNLVCGCTLEERREIREVVHDWAESMRLRINTGVSF